MLADSHRYRISTKNFIKIGQAVSEEYGNENCDTRILYIRRCSQKTVTQYVWKYESKHLRINLITM